MIEASDMIAFFLLSVDSDARRINWKNGECSLLFSSSQIADGIFFASRVAGRGVETSGKSSVISPRGSGRVLFTRRN